jgi:cystathionine beta-lyase
LRDHSGRPLHLRQARGNGSVISFTTGDFEFSKQIVSATRLFAIAVSFGSVNSSISLPCFMSHASVPDSLRSQLAPPADLIRLSVGIEDVQDLIDDLNQAINFAVRKGPARPKTKDRLTIVR